MIKVLLASAERRARQPFKLIDISGRLKFGLMQFNGVTSRHEIEMDLPDFLKASMHIAIASRLPGNCIFVAGVREVAGEVGILAPAPATHIAPPAPEPAQEPVLPAPEPVKPKAADELSAKSPYMKLKSIASKLGIDTTGKKNQQLFEAIEAAKAKE